MKRKLMLPYYKLQSVTRMIKYKFGWQGVLFFHTSCVAAICGAAIAIDIVRNFL